MVFQDEMASNTHLIMEHNFGKLSFIYKNTPMLWRFSTLTFAYRLVDKQLKLQVSYDLSHVTICIR